MISWPRRSWDMRRLVLRPFVSDGSRQCAAKMRITNGTGFAWLQRARRHSSRCNHSCRPPHHQNTAPTRNQQQHGLSHPSPDTSHFSHTAAAGSAKAPRLSARCPVRNASHADVAQSQDRPRFASTPASIYSLAHLLLGTRRRA